MIIHNNNYKKKHIVHIVTKEKFAVGYINFMKLKMNDCHHLFFLSSRENDKYNEDCLVNKDDIYYYDNDYVFIYDKSIRDILTSANKIIITGFFGSSIAMLFWPKQYLIKTYIHLWGGDFYCLRKKGGLLNNIYNYSRKGVFKRVYGLIFLLQEEEKPFMEITGICPAHSFVAPMMEDPLKENELFIIRNKQRKKDVITISVGNSADPTNKHVDAFYKCKELNLDKVEICSPLSYGNTEYAKDIIELGKELFKEKFKPMVEWMSKDAYFDYLQSVDVGIFLNDRQQALGNIYALLYMGKKVFLRKGTSMYNAFVNNGCVVFNENQITDYNILKELSEEERKRNRLFVEKYYSQDYAINKWELVLNDE